MHLIHYRYCYFEQAFVRVIKNKKSKSFYFAFVYSFSSVLPFFSVDLSFWPILYSFSLKKLLTFLVRNVYWRGFPGGAVVESLPAGAEDTGSSPGLGGSHMPQSNWAREPQLLSLRVWSLCSATREAAVVRGPRTVVRSGPRSPQLEKALEQKRRPNTTINK